MSKTVRIHVKWKIIAWAIQHGEKSYSDLSRNYSLKLWENPSKETDYPTLKQLQKFSNSTKIPFHYFLQDEVPEEKHSFVNFRTINNKEVIPSRRLIDTVHTMENRQAWMKDYLIEQGNIIKFRSIDKIDSELSIKDAANSISNLLSFADFFKNSLDDNKFYNLLKKKISILGILVMQNGIVNTDTHRKLDLNEFRAFALYDDTIPLIFINSSDSVRGKIFSLIHELVHILIGENEVLNAGPEVRTNKERWINAVTANILMPEEIVKSKINSAKSDEENLEILSRKFHTSLLATAIRSKELHLFPNCDQLIEWARSEQEKNLIARKKKKDGGPDFYKSALSKIDR